MAGFGGSVKLTGESEYRKALSQITQSLRVVSSEMKSVSSAYGTNDSDTKALATQTKNLTTALNQQKTALSSLKSQLAGMESEYKKTQTTHKALVAEYDREKAKLAEIAKTLGTSSAEYKAQQKVVTELEAKVQQSAKAYDSQTKALNNMRIQTANAETTVNNTAKALDKLGNEAEDAGSSAQKAGDGFTVFKGVLSNLASSAIQKALEGLKQLGTAVVNVGKQAVQSQADYEQLTGGVETLFKDSAKEVMKYADVAYKTAGLSANEYMETVTSFSASLLQGLGGDTARAAKIADMAIIDMSDNANKMGTSMASIQYAYQGFAKQNFTMLDNLKLGYGGTASEMARLINETGVMGAAFKATAENVKNVPFDKMIEAIHKVQQNMGITGTTALEASETISGSVASMKSAWQNLLTGIANSQLDRKQLVKNFTDSIKTAAKNLVPTIKETIKGLVETAEDLLNSLMGEDMFHFDGDAFVKGVEDTLKGVVQVFKWFIDNKDMVIAAIKGILAAFVVAKVVSFVSSIVSAISAMKTMVTATQGVNTAMQLLNGTLAANPFALIAGLVVGLGVALVSLASNTDNANKNLSETDRILKNSSESLKENDKSWRELQKAREEALSKGSAEMNHYQALANELDQITDKNGKVKEGYQERASFIASQLSEALGIEIKMNDGVIQGYDKIKQSIVDVIQQKKAKIVLDAQEAMYTEALEKQGEVLRNIAKLSEEARKANAEMYEYWDAYNAAMLSGDADEAQIYYQKWMRAQNYTENLNDQLEYQKEMYGKYAFNISQYEDNMAKFTAGKYDEMSQVLLDYTGEYKSTEEAVKESLQNQITEQETKLSELNELYKQKGGERYQNQITEAQNTLQNLQDQMKQYISATDTGLQQTNKVWETNLAKQLSTITGKNTEFRMDGEGNVQAYVDGVATGESKTPEEMKKVVQNAINEAKKDVYKRDAKTAGENVIDGVNSGVANQSKQSSVFRSIANFGSSLLAKLKASLQEHSPSKASKEMGQYLLEGLGIGIESEEKNIIDQVTSFGNSVVNALSGSLEDGVTVGAMDSLKAGLPSSTSSVVTSSTLAAEAQLANNNIVSQFKQALSEMKIEMDDQEMGRFVDNTVTKLVYN